MTRSSKNLFIILGISTIAFAGYYLFAQRATMEPGISDSSLEQMLISTQAFIDYRQTLNQVTLDFSIFEDERFRSLRSFSEPVEPKQEGRSNPFAPVGADSASAGTL